MTETFQHPIVLTPDPRQRTIQRMAQAGFRQYFQHRKGYGWENAVFATRLRWEVIAGEVYDRAITDPRGLRDRYQEDIYGAPSWSVQYILVWQGVLSAMRAVIGTTEPAVPASRITEPTPLTPLPPLRDRLKHRRGAA